ncbi:MAG: BlaI/MecI/CopY family transcriptional regulator [Planctomycetaceae bacterium]|nr:BlaI/MecI/CopY family transcriptional regulator [Planctomycetaceae bacterium]
MENNEKSTQISPSEWEVMRVLWNAERPLAAAEVREALAEVSPWSIKTVRTFLTRLVAKNAVDATRQKVAGYELLHYRPLVTEEETIRLERQNFLARFFGGTVQSMLASCIRSGDISREELEQIRRLIEEENTTGQGDHGSRAVTA